jgi:beta-lactamase regulating signal transducer with metallopeptidase domain
MMNPDLMLLAKLTLVLSAGLVGTRLLRGTPAATRHLVLACTFAAAAALPVAIAVLPQLDVAVPAGAASMGLSTKVIEAPIISVSTPTIERFVGSPAVPTDVALSPVQAARLVWAMGSVAVIGWLVVALVQLRRLRRTGVPALELSLVLERLAREDGVRRRVSLVTHERVAAPLTCGLRDATVLLPEDATGWSAGELQRALIHELEHVRRFDWPVQILARIVCAAFWFHPLAWAAWRQLRLEAERACDDAVLRRADSADYAEQLVGLARRLSGLDSSLSLAMAGRSDLARRVRSLLDPRQPRGRASSGAVAAITAVSLVTISSLAPIQAVTGTFDESEGQARSGRTETSLYRAANRGDIARMTELIDLGADVNAIIHGDGSPLIAAARSGHLAAVRLLLDRGANLNLAVEGDGNPLIMAAREGHVEVVKLLLDRGALIDQVVPSDETALIQASGQGRSAVVKLLLERRADPNIRVWAEGYPGREGEWRTALSQARRGRHEIVIRMLIEAGAIE